MSDNEQQEYEAAFAEAMGKRAAGDTAAEQPPTVDQQAAEPTQDEGAEPTPPADPETDSPDIWAGATEAQRAAFEAAEQQRKLLEHQRKSDAGRVARFQHERDVLASKLKPLAEASKTEDLRSYVQTERWKNAKAEYGDDLAPVFEALEKTVDLNGHLLDQIGRLGDDRQDEVLQRIEANIAERAPDYLQLLADPGLNTWLASQPSFVQDLARKNWAAFVDADEVTFLVDSYRTFKTAQQPAAVTPPQPQQDPRRAAQLDGARSVRSKPPAVAGPAEDDYEAHFQQAAAEHERQMATARR